MTSTKNWWNQAASYAAEIAETHIDEIVQYILDHKDVPTDINNDYVNGDATFHETAVDHYYNLTDAADLLDELSEFEESDDGLWEGIEPREAVSCQAAYTMGNATYAQWENLIEEIQSDVDGGIITDMLGEDDPVEEDKREEMVRARVEEIIRDFAK